MRKKIYLKDLDCYINASEKEKNSSSYMPNRCFNLEKLPNDDIADSLERFIRDRGKRLTPGSIRSDIYPFNLLCGFLSEYHKDIKSLRDVPLDEMEKDARKWLLKNGKNLTQTRKRTLYDRTEVTDSELVKYIRKIYKFYENGKDVFSFSSDKWYLKTVPFEVRDNPTNPTVSISFKDIKQPGIRHEIKKVIYKHLSQKAAGTVCRELGACKHFSGFLSSVFPEVSSLIEVDRDILEEYFAYINTASVRKSFRTELEALKSVFITAGKILDDTELERLFLHDDIKGDPAVLYKVYSEEEVKRLNSAIITLDVQLARVLFLHQLLGTRISEILYLKQDSVYKKEDGTVMIRIYQIKSRKYYEKPVNDEIKKIFDKACSYTNERYGKREFVFVRDKNPDEPMQYSMLKTQLMVLIKKNDLRDDSGEPFGVGTHMFRHFYGKSLTEMHYDDVMLSRLMGISTSTLRHYRKIGDKMMAEETKAYREGIDRLLAGIMDDWEK